MNKIQIDLTEDDCNLLKREVVYKMGSVEWVFEDSSGVEILVEFIPFQEDNIDEN